MSRDYVESPIQVPMWKSFLSYVSTTTFYIKNKQTMYTQFNACFCPSQLSFVAVFGLYEGCTFFSFFVQSQCSTMKKNNWLDKHWLYWITAQGFVFTMKTFFFLWIQTNWFPFFDFFHRCCRKTKSVCWHIFFGACRLNPPFILCLFV